jgi:hypothetical protein
LRIISPAVREGNAMSDIEQKTAHPYGRREPKGSQDIGATERLSGPRLSLGGAASHQLVELSDPQQSLRRNGVAHSLASRAGFLGLVEPKG